MASTQNIKDVSSASSSNNTTTVSCRLHSEPSNDYRVVVFGSAGVGKSSLVLRFVKGTFKDSYIPTIEDTYRQVITCNKQVCTLQITDTTGSHQFPAMQRLNIQKGHAFLLVYSIASKQSLEELKPIYKDILDIKGPVEIRNVPIMLVATKCDENTNRDVLSAVGTKLAQEWHCGFLETSAKTNVNVKEAFQELLKLDTRNNLSLSVNDSTNSTTNGSSNNLAASSSSTSTNNKNTNKNKTKNKNESVKNNKENSNKSTKTNDSNGASAGSTGAGGGGGGGKKKCIIS